MVAEQLDLIHATDGIEARCIQTVTELWATYFPGVTQEQAYWDARTSNDQRHELFRALTAVTDSHQDCRNDADLADYWKRLAEANAALLRFDGVPSRWIDEQGRDCAPLEICRYCWRPGAVDFDECGGCDTGYHPECVEVSSIRCDLRVAAYARVNGNEGRAVEWERIALARHTNQA